MRNHPLTPMRDANLVRVLARQTPHRTGLVAYPVVRRGAEAMEAAFDALRQQGVRHAVVDALDDTDLANIGAAAAALPLVTGGSGVAMGLPENFRQAGLLPPRGGPPELAAVRGPGVVLAGSCSAATLGQVEHMATLCPSRAIDPAALALDPEGTAASLSAWAKAHLASGPVLLYASASPEKVALAQARFGREQAGLLVEAAMARIASGLALSGVRRFVVAGGETAGAVVKALGIDALEIGPQIEPGVPATLSLGQPRFALALKSGNFGGPAFFLRALEALR
jgi:uncharacterized protein YgbK (DUF1537 family)